MSRQRPQRIQKNKQPKPNDKQGTRTRNNSKSNSSSSSSNSNNQKQFYLDFKTQAQKVAYSSFQQHDVLFLLGPAGVGKSHLAIAFAINEVLAKRKKKIILTRPVVEAGESLGFLPGTFEEKLNPYVMPMFDCIERCVGKDNPQREIIDNCLEIAPLAYMRGRTFNDSVCIFDESQNATQSQIKLFLSRFGENSKVIVTGDPNQSDLRKQDQGLMKIVRKLEDLSGIGFVNFQSSCIIRHPLISSILERLEENDDEKYDKKSDSHYDDYDDDDYDDEDYDD